MQKYLYLTKVEWTSAWVDGGEIPLSLASKYKRMDRDGIFTPDENLVHESTTDLLSLYPYVVFGAGAVVRNLQMTNVYVNGVRIPDIVGANLYKEDGLIQSFCNVFDVDIAARFGKAACVRIHDIDKLRKHIDKRLGVKSRFGDCKYTHDHQRNHFLKSSADGWQHEYRLFWPSDTERSVVLPAGVAEVVWAL